MIYAIPLTEHIARRTALLAKMAPQSVCLVSAASLKTRSNDTEYAFRQDSYFQYLTGFPEPDGLLLLSNNDDGQSLSVLFCLDKDPQAEIWHGRRIGPDAAANEFGFDEAYSVTEVEEALVNLIDGQQHLYFAQGLDPALDSLVFSVLEKLRAAPKQSKTAPPNLVDVRPVLNEMRLFKSEAELEIMRQAARISAQAHIRAMQFSQPGKHEYQLEAELHHEFAMQGAKHPAYGTIVGSGDNACILHYTENSAELIDGELVLIDAGAELAGYAADITRTFPVNGRFNEPQRQLYELVLAAQQASLALFKPGNILQQASDKAIAVLTQGLIELGLLSGDLQTNIKEKHYRQFYMHGLGHWLGLDVHDVGDYKINGEDRAFAAGMVLTIEPGLYVSPNADVAEKWRGIGIRIEDNVLITATGHEVLTSSVPKNIDEIEALMAPATC